ncbi:MAG TPA: glutamine-hydrolyzing carbamoyl-phosphate synthase small subunit [Candidatus Omnitrophota bacterium]|nr:glutamine-hydrolyzing carbamoyl-phosphate synthase small subunit [Candidatus Omnitrophota bacterium]HPS36499.1 glutamine-hydrolyzing carbamoyl-phosphate synthase small subunit [Candidatus Omnitrophota bacterium]
MTKAILALEDGVWFEGEGFGAEGEAFGEVVFNTGLSGYQEILTDPSYKGQMVCMTYPHIGNYGINAADVESSRPWVEGFIIKELSPVVSNYRSEMTLDAYLKKYNILGIQGIDTRKLVKHLRTFGAKKAVISTRELDPKKLVKMAKASPSIEGVDLVKEVTCAKPYEFTEAMPAEFAWGDARKKKYRIVAVDTGVKWNILRKLTQHGFHAQVVPASATAEEILAYKPDGLFLSNGPGDPSAVQYLVLTVRKLIGKLPMFGICLGHQMIGQALGGKTSKLKFGHHGNNQPVMDLRTRKIEITSQNHNFVVNIDSLPKNDVELTHINLNDKSLEGLQHKKHPLFCVQYHPENAPGPHDSDYLFTRFYEMISHHAG